FLAVEELSFQRYPRLSDLLTLFGLAVPENIGFRQLSTWWRFLGTVSAFREGQAWGKMTRRAFASERAEDLA
ncbi:MAG TPA: hypothetical protein VLA09_11220, partial [Longimicrobiales bacterium]|nr:hypothetical protein [Longimicrobiales bacterium]